MLDLSKNINLFNGDCNSIPIEDWEQVKEFVDSQIKLLKKDIK